MLILPPHGTGWRRPRRHSKACPKAMRTSPPRNHAQRGQSRHASVAGTHPASLSTPAWVRLMCGLGMRIEIEREEDGRWLAEISDLPGVLAYGETEQSAVSRVKALALRVLADRLEHGEDIPELGGVFTAIA